MDAKLDNLSEISKLLSVKNRMSNDILSLFSTSGLGRLLCGLTLEKHDGISAVQLILSLCLSHINGQIADATLCYITYIVMSLEKRMSEYETMGELFADMEDDVMALTL